MADTRAERSSRRRSARRLPRSVDLTRPAARKLAELVAAGGRMEWSDALERALEVVEPAAFAAHMAQWWEQRAREAQPPNKAPASNPRDGGPTSG